MPRLLAAFLTFACLSTPILAEDAPGYDPYPDVVVSDRIEDLPASVQATRQTLIDAAKGGKIEALAPIIAAQKTPPTVSFGDPEDPIEYLKTTSSDGEGREVLGILDTLMAAPYAVIGATSDEPRYVWPYLAMSDVTALSEAEKADARRILGEEQYNDLDDIGAWYYWRVFIGKNGDWQAFVAGD